MLEAIVSLFGHLRWSDQRALAALRASNGQPTQARELFAHVLGAEEVWLARLEGRTPGIPVWPDFDIEQCATWTERSHRNWNRYLERLTSSNQLEEEVAYVNSAGEAFRSTVRDILLQAALHGQYHRGQVALLLRASGFEPATTDYIAMVRGAPAATRQPPLTPGSSA
jgi:uncharacterized damage-inducible protein DinB